MVVQELVDLSDGDGEANRKGAVASCSQIAQIGIFNIAALFSDPFPSQGVFTSTSSTGDSTTMADPDSTRSSSRLKNRLYIGPYTTALI